MSEINKSVYCDALRAFFNTLIKEGGLSPKDAARWMNDALMAEDTIDFMDIEPFREYQKWLYEDIFAHHPAEWKEFGVDASKYVIEYIYNGEDTFALPEYFVDFDKLPNGITAVQFLNAFKMSEIINYLSKISTWCHNLSFEDYDCRSAIGVFISEYLSHGGDFELLLQKFNDEIADFTIYADKIYDFVPMAIDLKEAGLPVDLTTVAEILDSPSFLKKHEPYCARHYLKDMFSLSGAGAEIDLDQLATKVKRAKSNKKIDYDEYLELMRQLFEAGYETNYNKFAKSILKDLAQVKAFKYRYYTNRGHSELLEILENRGTKPEIIEELHSKIDMTF